MDKHFTVAVKVIEVTPPVNTRHAARGEMVTTEREVVEVLNVTIRAKDEDEAITKAINMLETVRPAKDEGTN